MPGSIGDPVPAVGVADDVHYRAPVVKLSTGPLEPRLAACADSPGLMFTGRHEQELAEIKALAYELGRSTQEVLERIKEARGQLVAHGPVLAFVHIPKTAGGTAINMFARAYSRAAVHDAGNYMKDHERTAMKVARRPGGWESWHRRGGRVTAGHVPYSLFRQHLPDDTRYMTFLREPVDRVLSHYHNHVRLTGTPADQRKLEPGLVLTASIEEALEMRLPQLTNLATRLLCADPSPMRELSASDLDDAKTNLREFAFVGVQEQFEESIVLLQRTLGLGLIPYLNRHVSVDRPAVEEISDEHRTLIGESNRLDAELYAFALGRFEEAVARPGEGFAADVETIRISSANAEEEAIKDARDWLDRELPVGTTKPKDVLFAAAAAAGISDPAVRHLLKLSPVQNVRGRDEQTISTRTDEVHVTRRTLEELDHLDRQRPRRR